MVARVLKWAPFFFSMSRHVIKILRSDRLSFANLRRANFHAPFLIRSWFKVFTWIKMWLASILIINTLTMLTIAHADRVRPTLKDGERFRNGLFHDLDNRTLMCTRSNLCYVRLCVLDQIYVTVRWCVLDQIYVTVRLCVLDQIYVTVRWCVLDQIYVSNLLLRPRKEFRDTSQPG